MPRVSSPRPIRWRKGEIIGAGAYGRVYMGMNLDSGELLAVKQVLIVVNNITKEKAQAHIRELEEEVRLLRNLSHPNIVRYLGTVREDEALNILLEFVPGGSIASLLGKFGSFTEPVIRMYTRQLLLGLEYLHSNNILHRDIKGANILVDNKGCIKLADFGASKKVVELATISEAKSMKGTPYWMAPEVIRQTGHNWQADIWSVGCTVIEMATGKPPWSQQFQEVAALFHIGTTKSHPPIPEHLSAQAKAFLFKCLQREPRLRPSATQLLKHPFVVENGPDAVDNSRSSDAVLNPDLTGERNLNDLREQDTHKTLEVNLNGVSETWNLRPPTTTLARSATARSLWDHETGVQHYRPSYVDDDDLNCSVRLDSVRLDSVRSGLNESFNPMSEPSFVGDGWEYKTSESLCPNAVAEMSTSPIKYSYVDRTQDDDDDVTESKIRAFLDEKALELKRLQTPLFEELYSIWNVKNQNGTTTSLIAPSSPATARLPGTGFSSKSPSKGSSFSGRSAGLRSSRDSEASVSSGSPSGGCAPTASVNNFSPLAEVPSPRLNEWKGLLHDTQHLPPSSPSLNSSERQRLLWKEELQQELEMKREEKRKLTRQASTLSNTTQSPNKEKSLQRYGNRLLSTPPTPPPTPR